MRVFMLGWEFPPFISGGLGTACHGLVTALGEQGVFVTFVLPRAIGTGSDIKSVTMLSPTALDQKITKGTRPGAKQIDYFREEHYGKVKIKAIPALTSSPYTYLDSLSATWKTSSKTSVITDTLGSSIDDLVAQADHYAMLCLALAEREKFDVIHAHDWFTFPAALVVAKATGKPLVVHVHSTEFDRAGQWGNQQIQRIENRGVHGADKVIAVSNLTRNILINKYGVDPKKIAVVHNGITLNSAEDGSEESAAADTGLMSGLSSSLVAGRQGREKIVLFLGRVTMQKGPEYFIAAAKRVLEKQTNVKFVVAGHGDRMAAMVEQVAREGLGGHVLFTGFLNTQDVHRAFKMADVYVMPSVSEPFGIAPLEAISHGVPVIVSRNAGVSEVLNHVLKVDFWDINQMAEKIVAVLRYAPLSRCLSSNASQEIARLTWSRAAGRCTDIYSSMLAP